MVDSKPSLRSVDSTHPWSANARPALSVGHILELHYFVSPIVRRMYDGFLAGNGPTSRLFFATRPSRWRLVGKPNVWMVDSVDPDHALRIDVFRHDGPGGRVPDARRNAAEPLEVVWGSESNGGGTARFSISIDWFRICDFP